MQRTDCPSHPSPAGGAEWAFPNGYQVRLGAPRTDGYRDVHVHDRHGRASGHTAVSTPRDLQAVLANVARRPPAAGRRGGSVRDDEMR